MNLDLGPAFTRAQAVVNGLVAAIPGILVALVVFGGTYDGRRMVVPNADLFTDTVVVNTAFEHRRLEYDVGIGYSDDIDRARGLILEAVRGTEGVLAEPAPDVLLMDFAPSSVSLRVRWWIAPPKRADALDARDKVLTAVKNQLTSHGIDLPFPTQQILFHDQTEDSDGDRARQREGWPAGNTDVPASRKVADAIRQMSGSTPRGAAGE